MTRMRGELGWRLEPICDPTGGAAVVVSSFYGHVKVHGQGRIVGPGLDADDLVIEHGGDWLQCPPGHPPSSCRLLQARNLGQDGNADKLLRKIGHHVSLPVYAR